jgi:hypothetical protein
MKAELLISCGLHVNHAKNLDAISSSYCNQTLQMVILNVIPWHFKNSILPKINVYSWTKLRCNRVSTVSENILEFF